MVLRNLRNLKKEFKHENAVYALGRVTLPFLCYNTAGWTNLAKLSAAGLNSLPSSLRLTFSLMIHIALGAALSHRKIIWIIKSGRQRMAHKNSIWFQSA